MLNFQEQVDDVFLFCFGIDVSNARLGLVSTWMGVVCLGIYFNVFVPSYSRLRFRLSAFQMERTNFLYLFFWRGPTIGQAWCGQQECTARDGSEGRPYDAFEPS